MQVKTTYSIFGEHIQEPFVCWNGPNHAVSKNNILGERMKYSPDSPIVGNYEVEYRIIGMKLKNQWDVMLSELMPRYSASSRWGLSGGAYCISH